MATKDRHKITVWITPLEYETLWLIKDRYGVSLNELASEAVTKFLTEKYPKDYADMRKMAGV